MNKLKQALKAMKPCRIECLKSIGPPLATSQANVDGGGGTTQSQSDCNSIISIEWTKEDNYLNRNRQSVIDLRPMQGVKSLRLLNTYDFVNETKCVRWIEIFLMKIEDEVNSGVAEDAVSFNLNRFADMISAAAGAAFIPVLDELVLIHFMSLMNKRQSSNKIEVTKQNFDQACSNIKEETAEIAASTTTTRAALSGQKHSVKLLDPFRVGLRVELNKDQVGYVVGMGGEQISDQKVLTSLDNELIRILHQVNAANVNILVEFVFSVQERLSGSLSS